MCVVTEIYSINSLLCNQVLDQPCLDTVVLSRSAYYQAWKLR